MKAPILALFGWLALLPVVTWSAVPPQIGSPGFRPTLEQPMGWRGDGSGRFLAATPPTSWSVQHKVRWSVRVGQGYSSPIVTDKDVLVTAEPNRLICLARANGRVLWKVETRPEDLPDAQDRKRAAAYVVPKNGSGLAAATPLTDGRNVYVVFANGIVRAVDLEGRSRWIAYLGADLDTAYGRSSSPILVERKLIVHLTHLLALDPATGRRLWLNTAAKPTYGTPAGIRLGGAWFIITPAGDLVRAEDGKAVLSGLGRSTYGTPLVAEDVVYFGDREAKAVRLTASLAAQELWSGEMPADVFGSPLLHEGVLFLTTGKGELFAFETRGNEAGKALLEGRLLFGEDEKAVPNTYSSLTLAGQYLFLAGNEEATVVLTATREPRIVGANKLLVGTGSQPVFSGKELFLRDGEQLYCIGE